MDIEGQQIPISDSQSQSPTKNNPAYIRQSVKSRMSNQSIISIPEQHGYPEKISLQSNMSQKLRMTEDRKGLFDKLINIDGINMIGLNQARTYGSNPTDYYHVNRMSEENERIEDKNQSSIMMEGEMKNQEQKIVIQKIICRCSKSKCLLMYCQCFSKGLLCNPECECYQCRNCPSFQQKRQKARQLVLQRDPNAFTNKLQVVGGEQTELAHKRGCNCKKTRCIKKYCECFNAGVKCTYLCHCEGCYNGGQNAPKE